jgi:hypothetical protein
MQHLRAAAHPDPRHTLPTRVWISSPHLAQWPRPRGLDVSIAAMLDIPTDVVTNSYRTYAAAGAPLAGRQYPDGLGEVFAGLTGLVLVLPNRRAPIGPGIVRELAGAQAYGLPVLVITPRGRRAALAECQVTALPTQEQTRMRRALVEMPAMRDSPAAAETLAAMGLPVLAEAAR